MGSNREKFNIKWIDNDPDVPGKTRRPRIPAFQSDKKRFYSRESIRGIRISGLAEILPIFHDSLSR